MVSMEPDQTYFDCKLREMKQPTWLTTTLRRQLEAQSEFCSQLGSCLGNILWDLSKCPYLAGNIAKNRRIEELLEMIRCTVVCYVAACKDSKEVWPGTLSTQETRLAISMAGIAVNLAASCPCLVLTRRTSLVQDVISCLPHVTAQPLTKLLLQFLYNISLDKVGAAKLVQQKAVLQAASKALHASPEVALSALKLLASLTFCQIPPMVLAQLGVERVRTLSNVGDAEMTHYANMILKNTQEQHQQQDDQLKTSPCSIQKQISNQDKCTQQY